ncbi:hypothetical protein Pfo_029224 [Paulownia fortunei]|nr:hypothetical protein Pfo_029224 [Paulownia fortunei]
MAFLDHRLELIFGILGNIISVLVYLAPVPTFIRIYREKSTMRFQSIPYVVALFSSILWIYYALLKPHSTLLISINLFGCIVETLYIFIYIYYASREVRIHTAKLLGLSMGLILVLVLLTFFVLEGIIRIVVVGWICNSFSLVVFAAPLSIVFEVIRTRSVEFMPFPLSFFLTLSAVVWFAYGLFKKDLVVAIPNIVGFLLGVLQMIIYWAFRNTQQHAGI